MANYTLVWYLQILSPDGRVLFDLPFNTATDFELLIDDQHIKPPFIIRFGDTRKEATQWVDHSSGELT